MSGWVKLSHTCWVVVTVSWLAGVNPEERFGVPDIKITVLQGREYVTWQLVL